MMNRNEHVFTDPSGNTVYTDSKGNIVRSVKEMDKEQLFNFFQAERAEEYNGIFNFGDATEWKFLEEEFDGLFLKSAGGMVPFQANGTLHGLPFYYRARGTSVSLIITDAEALDANLLYSAAIRTDEPETMDFTEGMRTLMPMLKRSEIMWYFPCKQLVFDVDNRTSYRVSQTGHDVVSAYGGTAEEAYERTKEKLPYWSMNGYTDEMQEEMWLAKEILPTPLNEDYRKFPENFPLDKK